MPLREVFRLTPLELQVVTTFLWEPNGYLDTFRQISTGKTLRTIAEELIELDDFVRSDGLLQVSDISFEDGSPIEEGDTTLLELALYWWEGRNNAVLPVILPPPPIPANWVAILLKFESSIMAGFQSVSQHVRDDTGGLITLFDISGNPAGSIRPGYQLAVQRSIGLKVRDVLE